jgi:hypothetical protein
LTDATTVEREVDNELTRCGPLERSRPTADRDRTEDRDFDPDVHHAGERSARSA